MEQYHPPSIVDECKSQIDDYQLPEQCSGSCTTMKCNNFENLSGHDDRNENDTQQIIALLHLPSQSRALSCDDSDPTIPEGEITLTVNNQVTDVSLLVNIEFQGKATASGGNASSISLANRSLVELNPIEVADSSADNLIADRVVDGVREGTIDESIVMEVLAEEPADSGPFIGALTDATPSIMPPNPTETPHDIKVNKRLGKKDQLRSEKGHFQCDDQKWEGKFALLKRFYQEHNHCIVPRNHPEIGDWASRQRRMYKLQQIPPDRKLRLDEIGFSWDRDSERWQMHYLELLEYKRVHGNCLVPRRFRENMPLARWVEAQRNYYNNDRKKISQVRIERLNHVGFAWSDNKKTEWDVRFQELVQYKKDHGDTLVPQRDDQTGTLGNWVVAQRYHFKKKNKRLTPDRIEKLNSIGFVWDASSRNCCAPGFKRKAKENPPNGKTSKTEKRQSPSAPSDFAGTKAANATQADQL